MSKSDIFDKYAEIAVQSGIVKMAKEDGKKSTRSDYVPSKNIAALYGVKPNEKQTIEYERNIAEYAHPNSVVISPAHNKINGLVENINERQDIIINIINDPANGHLNQRKYAESELLGSLIRVANDMDNRDMDEIRALADSCIDQLSKRAFEFKDLLNKDWWQSTLSPIKDIGTGAMGGAALLGIIGALSPIPGGAVTGARIGAALGGLSAGIFATGPSSKNVEINSEEAVNSLNKLIAKFPNYESLKTFKNSLSYLKKIASEYYSIVTGSAVSKDRAKMVTEKYLEAIEKTKTNILNFKKLKKGKRFEEKHISDTINATLGLFSSSTAEEVDKSLDALALQLNEAESSMGELNSIIDESLQKPAEKNEESDSTFTV